MDRMKQILGCDWPPEREIWIPAVLFKERNIDVYCFIFYTSLFNNNIIIVFK